MSVVLATLGVAFAAFCIWLMAESVNRQGRQSSMFSTAVLVVRKVVTYVLVALIATIVFVITMREAQSDRNWYLNSPLIAVMGIPASAFGVWSFVRWLNRRDDARSAERPHDAP
ncbi:MAG: hypothetical protein HY290_01320 [Planctomycetia bacterium]|nr:hypothetical protein [Planctomycetia bacterium]